MGKSVLSMEDIVQNANNRLNDESYFGGNQIKSLKEVAIGLELISEDSNFDSGIYLFEQGLVDYKIDKRSQLLGIFDEETRQSIKKKYVEAQANIAQLVGHIGKMGQVAPNLQKLLTSDLLLTSVSDYGLCYDFSKIEELLKNNDLMAVEEMAAKDVFFLKTYAYCFKSQKIANSLGAVKLTPQNKTEMNKTMQIIFSSQNMVKKAFPNNLKVTFKNLREKKLPTRNADKEMNKLIFDDLSSIQQVFGGSFKKEKAPAL